MATESRGYSCLVCNPALQYFASGDLCLYTAILQHQLICHVTNRIELIWGWRDYFNMFLNMHFKYIPIIESEELFTL
jgi:hypothetical protein